MSFFFQILSSEWSLNALVGRQEFISKQDENTSGLGRAAVFVYDPVSQTVNKVTVVVSRIEGATVLLSSGLSVEQKVVVTNVDQLKNNQKVALAHKS